MRLRLAVPSKEGVPIFDLHECNELSVIDVDARKMCEVQTAPFDPKDTDTMARQVEDIGIDILIAGGVRPDILDRLNLSRINLVTGVHGETVDGLAAAFLDGSLATPSHSDVHTPAE